MRTRIAVNMVQGKTKSQTSGLLLCLITLAGDFLSQSLEASREFLSTGEVPNAATSHLKYAEKYLFACLLQALGVFAFHNEIRTLARAYPIDPFTNFEFRLIVKVEWLRTDVDFMSEVALMLKVAKELTEIHMMKFTTCVHFEQGEKSIDNIRKRDENIRKLNASATSCVSAYIEEMQRIFDKLAANHAPFSVTSVNSLNTSKKEVTCEPLLGTGPSPKWRRRNRDDAR